MIQLASGTKILFSPNDDTQGTFLDLLNNAKERIHLADYSYNLPQVSNILVDKFKAGVDVKCVLDRSQSTGKTEIPALTILQQAGVPLKIVESSKHRIMHDKFCVIDDITEAGSWNFTGAASLENNFYFVFNNDLVAASFDQAFMDMWNGVTTVIEQANTKSLKLRSSAMKLPTKQQVLKVVEYGAIGFISTFVAIWAKQPDPFSKKAIIVALGAATGAVLAVVKQFVQA